MDINAFLSEPLFPNSFMAFTGGQLLIFLLTMAVLVGIWRLFLSKIFPWFLQKESLKDVNQPKIKRAFHMAMLLSVFLTALLTLGFDQSFPLNDRYSISGSAMLSILVIWQFARVANLLFSKFLLQRYYRHRDNNNQFDSLVKQDALPKANRLVLPPRFEWASMKCAHVSFVVSLVFSANHESFSCGN